MARRRWGPSWPVACPVRSPRPWSSWSPTARSAREPSCWWGRGPPPGPERSLPSPPSTRESGSPGCLVVPVRSARSRPVCCRNCFRADVSLTTLRLAWTSLPRGESTTCRPSPASTPPACWPLPAPASSRPSSSRGWSWRTCPIRQEPARPSRTVVSWSPWSSGSPRWPRGPTWSCRSACWRKPREPSSTGSIAPVGCAWSTSRLLPR